MKKKILSLITSILLFSPASLAFGEVKTFIKEYTYQARARIHQTVFVKSNSDFYG